MKVKRKSAKDSKEYSALLSNILHSMLALRYEVTTESEMTVGEILQDFRTVIQHAPGISVAIQASFAAKNGVVSKLLLDLLFPKIKTTTVCSLCVGGCVAHPRLRATRVRPKKNVQSTKLPTMQRRACTAAGFAFVFDTHAEAASALRRVVPTCASEALDKSEHLKTPHRPEPHLLMDNVCDVPAPDAVLGMLSGFVAAVMKPMGNAAEHHVSSGELNAAAIKVAHDCSYTKLSPQWAGRLLRKVPGLAPLADKHYWGYRLEAMSATVYKAFCVEWAASDRPLASATSGTSPTQLERLALASVIADLESEQQRLKNKLAGLPALKVEYENRLAVCHAQLKGLRGICNGGTLSEVLHEKSTSSKRRSGAKLGA